MIADAARATVAFVPGSPRLAADAPVELPLMLPHWQAEAVEAEARRHGITAGQLLRRVIGDAFPCRRAG